MRGALALLLTAGTACSEPTIDGLPPASDPDIQYIEWMRVPTKRADLAFVQRIIEDSERTPVAFVGAEWCGSCKAYKATLETASMKAVHAKVQIIELDLDHHRALLAEMNIRPAGVPHWEGLGEVGVSTGHRIDGRAWTADTEAQMSPVLQSFFDGA